MVLRAFLPLNTMLRPKHLQLTSVLNEYFLKWFILCVTANKTNVSSRMPVSTHDDHVKAVEFANLVYFVYDVKRAIDWHSSAKRKVILHVNNQKGFLYVAWIIVVLNIDEVSAIFHLDFEFPRAHR